MNSSLVPISKLVKEPYSLILGYPKATKGELTKRHAELKKLGVTAVSFQGETILNNIHVLGKGYVGVVVLSKLHKKDVALKIRRIDSSRSEMKSEAKLLKLANKVNVGPKLIDSSKNFIIMDYVVGQKITDWVRELKGRGSAAKLKSIVRQVLEDCHTLDTIHLDHGELSYIHKHVIVGESPCIIDFESGSTNRRTSNVTSATQSIFIGSALSSVVKNIIKIPNKKKLIDPLKKYKHEQSRENFDQILKMLGLDKS
ncbi:protein kinase [Candidatus Nitrosotalea bavarica]|uniref:protein kinase n=1 Tax=Candidatus Nitrosotalea bavarica TaxID=1903277 RepID=UPI000C7159F1|nr:protein kinase [Candidatus Nitrosotalea bavarica]